MLSNTLMRQVNRIGKVLLQVAAIGFFLNAISAYGACDMKMHASDVGAEESMPCHGLADEKTMSIATADADAEDCCSACVPVGISATIDTATQLSAETLATRSALILASSGFDPPFRPPIAVLS